MGLKTKRQAVDKVISGYLTFGVAGAIVTPPGGASIFLTALELKMAWDIGCIMKGPDFSYNDGKNVGAAVGIGAFVGKIAALEASHLLGPFALVAKPAIAGGIIKGIGEAIFAWFEKSGYSGDDIYDD